MKVKCIKTSIDKPDRYIFNSNLDDYLKIGSLFWVYGLEFKKNVTYVCVFFDERHLIEIPIELFEVIDDSISTEWKIKVWNNEKITLYPEVFYDEDFLENFSEWEEKERQQFEELRKKIEV